MSYPTKTTTVALLSASTTTETGEVHEPWVRYRSFSAFGATSAGAGSATILIEVSNDNTNFQTLGTFTLTLSTSVAQDGFSSRTPWRYVRAKVSAISGTNATVTVHMGVSQ